MISPVLLNGPPNQKLSGQATVPKSRRALWSTLLCKNDGP